MHRIAKLFFAASALSGMIGMGWGLQMSLAQDFTLSPAHAHLNLTGFVALAIFGAYYALNVAAAQRPLAWLHWLLAVPGVALFVPGVAYAVLGEGGRLALWGGVMVVASMAVFLLTVPLALRNPLRAEDIPQGAGQSASM